MGICCSTPEHPLVRAFKLAPTYGEKADIILKIASLAERNNRKAEAIVHYGTYIHCAAVHVYKEDAKKSRDLLLNKVNMARRIMQYRTVLESDIQRRQRNYIAPLISAPPQLAPWEWQEWLAMVRSTHASLDGLLERFGLVRLESQQSRLESQHSKDLAVAAAMASSVNVNPNINITGPTITNNPSISVNTGQTVAAAASPAGATAGAPAQAQYQPPIAPGLPVEQLQAPQKLAEQQAQYQPPPGYAMHQGQYLQQVPPGYVPQQYAQYQQAPPGYVPAGYVPAGYVPAPPSQQQPAPAVPQN